MDSPSQTFWPLAHQASPLPPPTTHTMTFQFAPFDFTASFTPAKRALIASLVCALGFLSGNSAFAQSQQPQAATPQGQVFEEEIVPQRYANNPNVDAFINDMVARYDFDSSALHDLFSRVSYSATAAKLVLPSPTPQAKNWRAYQGRFIEPVRINAGVKFWRANQATLQRAAEQFGVPPEVIVGIIGVETIYGKYMGNFRALDALTTLTFDYPNTPNRTERMATFRKNLEDLLVWTRDSQIDPTTVLGSYTGAIGIPQFLPSSIVQYAVDYDGNRRIDLHTSPANTIGSIANYLKQNGWEPERPVVRAVARHRQPCGDMGACRIEAEVERHLGHQPVGRAIILAADDRGSGGGGGVEHRDGVSPPPRWCQPSRARDERL